MDSLCEWLVDLPCWWVPRNAMAVWNVLESRYLPWSRRVNSHMFQSFRKRATDASYQYSRSDAVELDDLVLLGPSRLQFAKNREGEHFLSCEDQDEYRRRWQGMGWILSLPPLLLSAVRRGGAGHAALTCLWPMLITARSSWRSEALVLRCAQP